jgi:anti-sigma factor RsiW
VSGPAVDGEIAEEDLHAYADGLLPARRRADVEGLLAANPDLARRAETYRRLNVDLHAVCDGDELYRLPPNLARLGRELDSNLRHQRVLLRIVRAAASLALAATVAASAGWAGEWGPAGSAAIFSPPPEPAFSDLFQNRLNALGGCAGQGLMSSTRETA